MTSINDLSTLLFGIYNQTFPGKNSFDITCGSCKKTTSLSINNEYLIEYKGEDVYAKVNEILYSNKPAEELLATSLVGTTERLQLEDSKIIVDIYTPTLYDNLILLKSSTTDLIEKYANMIQVMSFVKGLYILDMETYKHTGEVSYYQLTKRQEILSVLLKLSSRDGIQLANTIEKRIEKYAVNYAIQNITCSHCGTKLDSIDVDMESVLFTRLDSQEA